MPKGEGSADISPYPKERICLSYTRLREVRWVCLPKGDGSVAPQLLSCGVRHVQLGNSLGDRYLCIIAEPRGSKKLRGGRHQGEDQQADGVKDTSKASNVSMGCVAL